MSNDLAFIHRFEPANRLEAPPLLLLHGTGGDENDLLPLGRLISPGSALLSPRGKVLENGMPRFFRRLAEGVFDEDDVRQRAHELADFVDAARNGLRHRQRPSRVGYSNGANIAAAMMLLRPDVLAGAALLRAMVPLSQPPQGRSLRQAVCLWFRASTIRSSRREFARDCTTCCRGAVQQSKRTRCRSATSSRRRT